MQLKFLAIALSLLFCSGTLVSAADKGFFFGGSFSSRFINGQSKSSFTYETNGFPAINTGGTTTSEQTEIVSWDFNITDRLGGYGFESSNLVGFNPIIGFRVSDNAAFTASYHYYFSLKGVTSNEWFYRYRDEVSYPIITNSYRYDQSVIKLTGEFYPGIIGLFVTGGFEYSFLKMNLDRTTEWEFFSTQLSKQSDQHATGWLIGIGLEHRINQHMTFVGVTSYSFSKYSGNGLILGESMDNFEINLGGYSTQLGLRYFIK